MKITAQEEYGLRILVRIARCKEKAGISIPQLSEAEGLSPHYIAKLTRVLRLAGFINSTPGYKGGYILARPANDILINTVLIALGGNLFDKKYCGSRAGTFALCTHSVDCSVRSLWQIIQHTVDQLLQHITLYHLMSSEEESAQIISRFLQQNSSRNMPV